MHRGRGDIPYPDWAAVVGHVHRPGGQAGGRCIDGSGARIAVVQQHSICCQFIRHQGKRPTGKIDIGIDQDAPPCCHGEIPARGHSIGKSDDGAVDGDVVIGLEDDMAAGIEYVGEGGGSDGDAGVGVFGKGIVVGQRIIRACGPGKEIHRAGAGRAMVEAVIAIRARG